jgi:hypothetical protein
MDMHGSSPFSTSLRSYVVSTHAHVSVWVSPHLSFFLATSFTNSGISHLLKAETYMCNGIVFLYFITFIKGLELAQECTNTILKKQKNFQLANNNTNTNRHLMLTNTFTDPS